MMSVETESLHVIALNDASQVCVDLKKYCYNFMHTVGFFVCPFPIANEQDDTVLGTSGKLYKGFLKAAVFDKMHPHLGEQKGGSERTWKEYLHGLWQRSMKLSSKGAKGKMKKKLHLGLKQGLNARQNAVANKLKCAFQGMSERGPVCHVCAYT